MPRIMGLTPPPHRPLLDASAIVAKLATLTDAGERRSYFSGELAGHFVELYHPQHGGLCVLPAPDIRTYLDKDFTITPPAGSSSGATTTEVLTGKKEEPK